MVGYGALDAMADAGAALRQLRGALRARLIGIVVLASAQELPLDEPKRSAGLVSAYLTND